MRKAIIAIMGVLALLIAAGFVVAEAYGRGNGARYTNSSVRGTHYEAMEKIFDEGTYQDLVDYREEAGFIIMPWVQSEDDFELAKQMHERMEEWREQNDNAPGYGMMGKGMGGRIGQGGCPMRNAQSS